ncbi:MAG: hypothetical protein Ta2F_17940 [Termitinemataceae bacterium]|nr:MAG: hypothetical protein Ta2F_17940 [Termitinemataceae bacterium]
MKKNTRKQFFPKLRFYSCLVFIALTIFLIFEYEHVTLKPLQSEMPIELPTYATENNERIAIISNSESRIIIMDNTKKMLFDMKAEKKSAAFTMAQFVALDDKNKIYILDSDFGGSQKDNIESIKRYSENGEFEQIIYENRYINDRFIITKGKIAGLTYFENKIYIIRLEDTGFFLEAIDTNDGYISKRTFFAYPNAFRDLTYSFINVKNSRIAFTSKAGSVLQYNFSGELLHEYHESQEQRVLPWGIVSDEDNNLIYTDIFNGTIVSINTYYDTKTILKQINEDESAYYRLNYKNKKIYAASADNTLVLDSLNGENLLIDTYTYKDSTRNFKCFLFTALILDFIAALFLIACIFIFISKKHTSHSFKLILAVGFSITAGASLASFFIISEMNKTYNQNVFKDLENISRLISPVVDTDIIKSLQVPSDYNNPDFIEQKEKINTLFSNLKLNGEHVYQIIYGIYDGKVCVLHDLESSAGIFYPSFNFKDSIYEKVVETKSYQHVDELIDSAGSWFFVCGPILDENNEVVALIETGYDMQMVQEHNRTMLIQTMLIVISAAIALLFTLIEIILVSGAYKKTKQEHSMQRRLVFHPEFTRIVTFIMFTVSNLPTAFLPIYASRLYVPMFNLPRELVITMPFIADMGFAALALFIVPLIIRSVGVKKIALLSTILIVTANALCFLATNTIFLTFAYALTGFAGGAMLLVINTIIGAQKKTENVNSGFANFNAGYLAGINVGLIFGSGMAQFFDYRIVYLLSTLTAIGMLALILYSVRSTLIQPIYEASIAVPRKGGTKDRSVFKFICEPLVFASLIFLLLPYAASMSFTSYFMPVFALDNGLSESNIGQLMLLSGLFAILFGTSLCDYLQEKVPAKIVIAAALSLNIFSIFLFSLNVSVIMLITTILIMAVANIFALTYIQTYYAGLFRYAKVSSTKALSIYSAVENIAMAMGPTIFSFILTFNIEFGMKLVSFVLGGCLVLYYVISAVFRKGTKGLEEIEVAYGLNSTATTEENIKTMTTAAEDAVYFLEDQVHDLNESVIEARFLADAARDMLEIHTESLKAAEDRARKAQDAAQKAEATRVAVVTAAEATEAAIAAASAAEAAAEKAAEEVLAAEAAEKAAREASEASVASKALADQTLKAAEEAASLAVSSAAEASEDAIDCALMASQIGPSEAAEKAKTVEAVAASLMAKADTVKAEFVEGKDGSLSVTLSEKEAVSSGKKRKSKKNS